MPHLHTKLRKPNPAKDLTGRIFGRLTVLSFIERSGNRYLWLCQCSCGKQFRVDRNSLTSGNTKSCGCFLHEHRYAATKHGFARAGNIRPEYGAFTQMHQRCNNPNNVAYSYYGGRGIVVCEAWKDFRNFINDMGNRPPGHTLDRINPDGNYEPSNCRWVSFRGQTSNRMKEVSLKHIGYNSVDGFFPIPHFLQ